MLTERELEDFSGIKGFDKLTVLGAPLKAVGLADENVRHNLDLKQLAAGNAPVHVLVVVRVT